MNKLRLKNQRKTLKVLIDMSAKTRNGLIWRPKNFPQHFSFLTSYDLVQMLTILEDKKLIAVQYADLPDNFNINIIKVLPAGFDFEPQISYDNWQRWIDRLVGFVSGVAATIVADLLLRQL